MAKRWTKKKVKLVRKQARNTSRRITSTGREIREDAARTVRLVRRNVIAGIRRVSGRDEPNHLANPIDGLEDLAISGDAVPMLVENQQDPDVVMTDAPPRGSEGSDNTTIVHVTSSLAQKGQDRGLQPSFTYDTKYSDYYQQAKEQYEQHQQQQQQLQEQQEQLQQQQLELLQQQQEVQQLQLQQQQQQQLSSPLNQSQSQSQDQSQDQSRGYPFSEAVTGTPSHTYNFPPYHDQTIEGVILQLELLRILHETYGHPADQSDGSSPQNAGENDGNGNNRQDSGGSYLPEFDFTPELEISEPDDGWGDSAPGQSRLLLEFNQKGSAHADLYGADDTAIAVPGSDEDVPTIGVEMEFLVALFPRGAPDYADPHPRDGRYLSEKFTDLAKRIGPDEFQWSEDTTNYGILKLIKQLRLNDIAAHNTAFAEALYCEYSDSENEETADWEALTNAFSFGIPEDPSKDRDYRELIGNTLFEEWEKWCGLHGFEMRLMKQQDTDRLADRIFNMLQGPPNNWVDTMSIADVADEFHSSVLRAVKESKEAARDLLRLAVEDPDHVPADGLQDRYKGWICTIDGSVNGIGMGSERYRISEKRKGQEPMSEYWFLGAEINSPCYAHHSAKTADNIRKTCGVLRGYFRTHKPMELSSGLHVHLGHTHGFNLLQVKRFVTLWIMIEDTLMQCHRKDRDMTLAGRWCGRIFRETHLSRWLFADSLPDRMEYGCEPKPVSEQARQADLDALDKHVALNTLIDDFQLYLKKVWTYPTLSDLSSAMKGADAITPGARIRIEGGKTSTPAGPNDPQTIEIRTMHGTLDADHINQWIIVLGRIMHYVRDITAEVFRAKISEILDAEEEEGNNTFLWRLLQILEVPEETRRFFLHPYHRATHHANNKDYWVYPDRDRVDWDEPFNEPGHGATHGPQWDNWHTFP